VLDDFLNFAFCTLSFNLLYNIQMRYERKQKKHPINHQPKIDMVK